MPNGNVHNLSIMALAATLPAATLAAGVLPTGRALALAAGCLSGLLLSPDLDIDHGNISYKIVRDSVGCLPGALWKLFWWPYARLIPHRSLLSHGLLVGTLLRLLYLFAVPWLLWCLASLLAPLPPLPIPHWSWLPYAVAGLIASDSLHSVMDVVWR